MKPCTTKNIMFTILTVLAAAMAVTAAPVNFSEVSLWVRARETDQSIVREVSQRKLTRALTPQQEATLKSQGASDSLVQSLRSPNVIAAPADVAASEVRSQPPRMPQSQEAANDSATDNFHIVEVSSGYPIISVNGEDPIANSLSTSFDSRAKTLLNPSSSTPYARIPMSRPTSARSARALEPRNPTFGVKNSRHTRVAI